MKLPIVVITILLVLSACSKKTSTEIVAPVTPPPPVHIPLDATVEDYQSLLQEVEQKNIKTEMPPIVEQGIRWGTRLTSWLATVNAERTDQTVVRLSSANLQKKQGVPIGSPAYLSEDLLKKLARSIEKELPPDIFSYLEGGDVPTTPEFFSDQLLVTFRKVSYLYESSARFKLLYPYLSYYKEAKSRDVRPYYFFINKKWSMKSFETMANLPAEEQKVINAQIQSLCELRWDIEEGENRKERCTKLLADARNSGSLPEQWVASMAYGKALWNSFFDISDKIRSDVNHTDNNLLIIPFKRPHTDALAAYLKDNVEDEFRFGEWAIKVNFSEDAAAGLIFEPGASPHVKGLAGNEIIMDENVSIEEFNSKWMIRHEFGHILGLPDCYHEFYDEDLKSFVNYQLDVDDLMCSRQGKMQERIKNELQRVYIPKKVLSSAEIIKAFKDAKKAEARN